MNGEKLSVLIADDEYRIAMMIKKLIHWEDLCLECLDVVEDGETALDIIREHCPDIVIADIKMPKINGLELIRMTKEMNKDTRFIVVSGYKEFDYVHQALQYGVDNYLLKPINEDKLNESLRKICQRYCTDRENRLMLETVSESRRIIMKNFFNDLLKEDKPYESNEILQGGVYRGVVIKLDYVNYSMRDRMQDKIALEKIISITERILNEDAMEVLTCEKENLYIYCLLNYQQDSALAVRDSFGKILSEIQKYLMEFEQYEVTVGIGNEKKNYNEIRFSIKEAYRAVGNRIRRGSGKLIYADSVGLGIPEEDWVKGYYSEVQSAVEGCSTDKLNQCIDGLFEELVKENDRDYSYYYDIAEEFINCFFNVINDEALVSNKKQILEIIYHCNTYSQLKKILKQNLGECMELHRKAMESKMVKPVRQAQKYIEEHYGEKIALEDIANIVFLNPVYFSVLFKKETKMNFSVYLATVRIKKAKEMLCSTNDTIAVIGERVGYKDTRYFSQIFEKMVGVKPALYRRLHS